MPTGASKNRPESINPDNYLKVVHFPSCVSRVMGGPAHRYSASPDLPQITRSILKKSGCEIIYPDNLDQLCCGQAFESKGFRIQADRKSDEVSEALLQASKQGDIPILCDTSRCLYRMQSTVDPRLHLYEPIEFVLTHSIQRLKFSQKHTRVAIHPTCSTRKMGLENRLFELASACAEEVVMPPDIYCCGFAGDLGFKVPELNAPALKDLKAHVCTCEAGYSTSLTCEIGLSLHGGIPYRSILHLIDDASEPIDH